MHSIILLLLNSGDYEIAALVDWANDSSNSFFAAVDVEPTTSNIWTGALTTDLQSRPVTWGNEVTPHVFTLTAGRHSLIVRGREANAKLGRITITSVSSPTVSWRSDWWQSICVQLGWHKLGFQAKLVANDGASLGGMGAINGDTAIAAGSGAYVFTRSGTVWTTTTSETDC